MAGGEGSRLRPASTPETPKPFLRLLGDSSLFQQTLERFAGGPEGLYAPPAVICAASNLGLMRDQAAAAGRPLGPVVAETVAAGTTICAALGALVAKEDDPDALVLLAPADHLVSDAVAFHSTMTEAAAVAATGRLVVFGAPPTAAATGFGYVRPGRSLPVGRALEGFVEKPDARRAAALVGAGWWWNAGLFLGTAATLLAELAAHAPHHLAAAKAAFSAAARSGGVIELDASLPTALEPVSFDSAVMERSRVGAVLPFDCGWSDLGTWDAVWNAGAKDAAGNVARGDADLVDVAASLVHAQGLPVRVVGLADVIVVATPSGVLVSRRP